MSGCALTLSTSRMSAMQHRPHVCHAAPAAVSPVLYSGAALIRRIMDLTPQQVEALPADQKAQVIALQNQVVSSPSRLAMLLCCCGQAQQDSPFCHTCAESKPKHAGVMRSTIQYSLSPCPVPFTAKFVAFHSSMHEAGTLCSCVDVLQCPSEKLTTLADSPQCLC